MFFRTVCLLACIAVCAFGFPQAPGSSHGLSQREIDDLAGVRQSALDLAVSRGIFCGRATMGCPRYMTRQVVAGMKYQWVSYVATLPGDGHLNPGRCFVSGFYKFTFVNLFGGNGQTHHVDVEQI